jgi:cell division protein FtsQ
MSALTVSQPSQKVSMLAGMVFLLSVVVALTLLMMRLYDWAVDAQKLPVKDIIFGGEFIHLDVNEMKKQMKTQYPQSFIAIDVNEVHREIENLPWVYRASVR